MSGAHSRRKGAQGERELVALAKRFGFNDARRTAPLQAWDGDAKYPDVEKIGRFWAENKRHRRVNVQAEMRDLLAKERPGYVRVLFHRDDGGPALATLEAEELLKLEAAALGVKSVPKNLLCAWTCGPCVHNAHGECDLDIDVPESGCPEFRESLDTPAHYRRNG